MSDQIDRPVCSMNHNNSHKIQTCINPYLQLKNLKYRQSGHQCLCDLHRTMLKGSKSGLTPKSYF
jgi:hypothetical protein